MESELEKSYSVKDSQFTESQRGGFDDSIKFYESVHSLVIDNKTNKKYYRLEISKKNSVPQRYKNFLYIVGNHAPFGKFRGYSEDGENFYPYIEYDPQNTLQNFLEGGFDDIFTDTVKCKTVFAIAAALEYCHTLDVSCRFIHPESIFYSNGNPYISNFGYSETILNAPNRVFNSNMTKTSNPIFHDNACYLAPELLKDPNAFSFQSDMYSFGALLFSLITRKKLFESNNEKDILNLIEDNQYPKIENDQCSPLLIDITQNCLSKDPNKRYTSSDVLEKLISADMPLFPDCDQKNYSKYKEEILKNTYYSKADSKTGLSSRGAFTIGSRLLKKKSNLENISFSEKKEIFEYFRLSAKSGFSPAIYRYALLLDSKIETYVVKAVSDKQPFDPFYCMEKSISNGIYKAPIQYGEMYDRRGYHDHAASIYSNFSQKDDFCLIRSMIISGSPPNKSFLKPISKIPNPDIRLEIELFEETEKIKNLTQNKMRIFINKMPKLAKTYKNGKPLYYLAIFYKEGIIPESVRRGINGYLSIDTKIDKNPQSYDFLGSSSIEIDDDEIIEPEPDEESYKLHLKDSANLLYEPAVAEYVLLLLHNGTDTKENKIKEATDLLNKFFNTFRCLNDFSKIRIQHARAKLLEINGKRNNNPELVKKALRLYKEAADGGLVAGVVDYLRLYKEGDDKNDMLIKYYQKRLDKFNT